MELSEGVELIRPAIHRRGGVWADFGAGEGFFTRALAAAAGPGARIVAVEQDRGSLHALRSLAAAAEATIEPVRADFREVESIPGVEGAALDGALFANSLHYVADPAAVLARVARLLRPDGRIVVVEYDSRPASRWVPYPLPPHRLAEVARGAGLPAPTVAGTLPSRFGGNLYCAVLASRSGTA